MDTRTDPRAELPLAPHVFEILLALSEAPSHGYAIIRAIEDQSGGAVRLSTSSLYAALHKMERRRLVEDAGRRHDDESGGPPRRYFRITDFGVRTARLEALRLKGAAERAWDHLGVEHPGEGGA